MSFVTAYFDCQERNTGTGWEQVANGVIALIAHPLI